MENSEPWLPQYAQQMQLRSSVVHPTPDYLSQYLLPAATTTEVSQTAAQHPELVAQLNSGIQSAHQNTGSNGHFGFHNSFYFNQTRPSVLQHGNPEVANQFGAFSNPLFPFPNYFGFPCPELENQFHPPEEDAASRTEPEAPPFSQEDLFNNFATPVIAYNPHSLEAMLKENKLAETTEADVKPHSEKTVPKLVHECQVCQTTQANGLHFGARTCAACAAFFRRTISDSKKYVCKRSQRCNNTQKDAIGYRKLCRACRLKRCMDIGMLPENVQHKRSRIDSPSRYDPLRTIDTHASTSRIQNNSQDTPPVLNRFDHIPLTMDRPSLESMFPFYNRLHSPNPEDDDIIDTVF